MIAWLVRVIARGWRRFEQALCGLHGHDALLNFERGRLSLLCTSCGHETPGWDCSGAVPQKPAKVMTFERQRTRKARAVKVA